MGSVEVKTLICVLLICIVPKFVAQLSTKEAIIQTGKRKNVGNSIDAASTETSLENETIIDVSRYRKGVYDIQVEKEDWVIHTN